jgi:hypothetical protein
MVINPTVPKVASGNMANLTPAEALALAQGTLAHFGTYTVDPAAGTFTVMIQFSSFPNFAGVQQVRTLLQLDDDTLSYDNPVSASVPGAHVIAVLQRVFRFEKH